MFSFFHLARIINTSNEGFLMPSRSEKKEFFINN